MSRSRTALVWAGLLLVIAVPIVLAMMSPLLAWRDPIYILAGFAGIVALSALLFQPLLAANYLPGVSARLGRRFHKWAGFTVVLAVLIHVLGLWVTSPPDVIDALLFVSPTAFSVWGVIAMWAVFAVVFLVFMKRRIQPLVWRTLHMLLVFVIVGGSVVHAIKIEGAMETVSKLVLCIVVVIVTAVVWIKLLPRR